MAVSWSNWKIKKKKNSKTTTLTSHFYLIVWFICFFFLSKAHSIWNKLLGKIYIHEINVFKVCTSIFFFNKRGKGINQGLSHILVRQELLLFSLDGGMGRSYTCCSVDCFLNAVSWMNDCLRHCLSCHPVPLTADVQVNYTPFTLTAFLYAILQWSLALCSFFPIHFLFDLTRQR